MEVTLGSNNTLLIALFSFLALLFFGLKALKIHYENEIKRCENALQASNLSAEKLRELNESIHRTERLMSVYGTSFIPDNEQTRIDAIKQDIKKRLQEMYSL